MLSHLPLVKKFEFHRSQEWMRVDCLVERKKFCNKNGKYFVEHSIFDNFMLDLLRIQR